MSEGARGTIRFSSVSHLVSMEDDLRIMSIWTSVSCLITIANVKSDAEASQLIDFLTKVRMAQKHMTIVSSTSDTRYLQNRTINFDVMVKKFGPGASANYSSYQSMQLTRMFFSDGESERTFLCPTLGKTHAVLHNRLCPKELENPYGKELKISFIGASPFISYSPVGGSDILLVNMLAEKFKFIPKFIPERSYDPVIRNGIIDGMLYRVRRNILFLLDFLCYSILHQVSSKQSELGIGQPNFADYRYRMVDYLPAMNMYEYLMVTKKPQEIVSYDTIIYPLDTNVWLLIICSSLAEFTILYLLQNLWSYTSNRPSPHDYIFEGYKWSFRGEEDKAIILVYTCRFLPLNSFYSEKKTPLMDS